MAKYIQESFKKSIVYKISRRGSKTIEEIAKENEVSLSSISRWIKKYGIIDTMETKKNNIYTSEYKLKVVSEVNNLSEHEFGEYLRKNGLHSNQVDEWKQEIVDALSCYKDNRKIDPEIFRLRKQQKQLEKEIRRKDKALAEASALLILKKKAKMIWGSSEEEKLI